MLAVLAQIHPIKTGIFITHGVLFEVLTALNPGCFQTGPATEVSIAHSWQLYWQ